MLLPETSQGAVFVNPETQERFIFVPNGSEAATVLYQPTHTQRPYELRVETVQDLTVSPVYAGNDLRDGSEHYLARIVQLQGMPVVFTRNGTRIDHRGKFYWYDPSAEFDGNYLPLAGKPALTADLLASTPHGYVVVAHDGKAKVNHLFLDGRLVAEDVPPWFGVRLGTDSQALIAIPEGGTLRISLRDDTSSLDGQPIRLLRPEDYNIAFSYDGRSVTISPR